MTKEYNDLIRTALRPDGVYLLTVIESLTDGPFLRAAVRTMQQSFGEVLVLSTEADFQNKLRDVYIIAGYGAPSTDPAAGTVHAAELPIQVRDDTGSGSGHGSRSGPVTLAQLVAQTRAHSVPLEVMQQILAQDGPRGIILTDHYAPVDRLMSRIYLPPRKP